MCMSEKEIKELRFYTKLCEACSDLAYSIHLKYLERGDEVTAVRIFEELVLPFERLRDVFKTLEKIKLKAKGKGEKNE